MTMLAEDFVIPKWVKIDAGATDKYARFMVEPFERGYGTTVGNSLRRVLLASLSGAAVTALRVEGVNHEFSAIPGVEEDMTDVVLNVKKCDLSLKEGESLIFSYTFTGRGDCTAGQLFKGQEKIACHNPDHILFTSTNENTKLDMEIKVAKGRGYMTADKFELEHAPLGTIYLDASFSPVTKVNFQVEDARVGQMTDYDRLLLDIWTNGSITPDQALREAANLLIEHLRIFALQQSEEEHKAQTGGGEDSELQRVLSRPVEELELSVRAANCLKAADIKTIGELVSRSEGEMLGFHNFGKKSLDEIKSILETMGLSLGMGGGAVIEGAPAPAAPAAAVSDEEYDDEEDPESDED
jgi:DNA-directed RNA polymerase subunit alpha